MYSIPYICIQQENSTSYRTQYENNFLFKYPGCEEIEAQRDDKPVINLKLPEYWYSTVDIQCQVDCW